MTTNLTEAALLAALTAPNTQAPPVVRVLKLDGIKAKKDTKAGKTEYPSLPDPDGTYAQIAAAFLKAHEDCEAAKTRMDMHGGSLKQAVRPFYFEVSRGLPEPSTCVSVFGPTGEVLIQCKRAYKKVADPAVIEKVIGPDLTARYFRQKTKVEIDFDAVPEDKQEQLAERLVALAQELGITDALSQASSFAPSVAFHSDRHRALTIEQNLNLEAAFGNGYMTLAATSAKGRK